jgi:Pyridine nucleotide-disulphide oxidoreductase
LQIDCEAAVTDGNRDTPKPWKFKIAYDKLVIACGAEASTFGIDGVKEHAIFLREVHHAQEIRRKLLLNLMLSDMPGMCSIILVLISMLQSLQLGTSLRMASLDFSKAPSIYITVPK